MNQLTLADFQEMEMLEREAYGEEFIAPAVEAFRWYQANPMSVRLERQDHRIAGFINLFPVKEEIASQIKAGLFNDSMMTSDDMLMLDELPARQEVPLFLSCVVVGPAFRNRGIAKRILSSYIAEYAALPNVSFGIVLTDNVTEEGARFSQSLGFQPVTRTNHDSIVYATRFSDLRALLTKRGS